MTGAAMFTLRRRLLGLLLVVVLAGGVTLSIALYDKAFSTFVNVKLEATDIGNQLLPQSDVKVRGLIVGSVQSIRATSQGAELTLALDPVSAKEIPADVSARFLPKTLFGERYVSLEIPPDPAPTSLRDGAVIPEDRSSSAVELSKAIDDLLPVLQAVEPQKLSATLTAISTALHGRGDQIGDTLSRLGTYLGDLNPHLPQLQQNLGDLAKFSDNLSDSAPELVQTLDNLSTTATTVVAEQRNLQALYTDLTGASQTLESFLRANSSNLISLSASARPTAELLAEYAPEYPCLLGQLSELVGRLDQAFGKGTDQPGLHATIEVTVNRGAYEPGQDEPRYDDKRGPQCYDVDNFPLPSAQYPPNGPLKDGSTAPPAPRGEAGGDHGGGAAAGSVVNSVAEQDFLAQLVGPQVGMAPADVPAWSDLLVGPLYRGAEVTVR